MVLSPDWVIDAQLTSSWGEVLMTPSNTRPIWVGAEAGKTEADLFVRMDVPAN